MTSPLLGSLAKTIGSAFKGLFLDATLSRSVASAGPNEWTPGTVTTTNYACKAIHDTWSTMAISSGLVSSEDVKLLILAASCPVEPVSGDVVTIRGESFTIGNAGGTGSAVETDPARAVWTTRAKK